MTRKRDIAQEIAAIRARHRFGSAGSEMSLRLGAIERALHNRAQAGDEFLRYFPVALIACIEGYFRMAIKELVDSGEPFLSRAEGIALPFKLDFSTMKAIHGRSVTVGELVAHGVPMSRIDHVESALSKLIGPDSFLTALRPTSDRWAQEVEGETQIPIMSDPDSVYADVARTFELRHIICHELASAHPIESQVIEGCFESCALFLKASDAFISDTLHPGAPLTQSEMNQMAAASLELKEEELKAAIEAAKSEFNDWEVEAFEESQSEWQRYYQAWAKLAAGDPRSLRGSIWPVIYAELAGRSIVNRIEEIEAYVLYDS